MRSEWERECGVGIGEREVDGEWEGVEVSRE